MAFLDTRLPVCVSFGTSGGPSFLTDVVTVNSGIESRNQVWSFPRIELTIAYSARRIEQWEPLVAFFYIAQGRANTWRAQHETDHTVKDGEGVLVSLTATTFQMYKRYTYAGLTYDRKITKPVSPSTITGGVSPTVNYSTGVVTVVSGTPTAWGREFDFHCRFDTDRMQHETLNKNRDDEFTVGWDSIPIVEVKET